MNDTNKPLPPLPSLDEANQGAAVPPPLPKGLTPAKDEHIMSRPLRYTVSIVLLVAALIGTMLLITFVRDVLMDEHEGVTMQHIELEEYVINDPPLDTRRSHVRMKPGSHPEAGYIADESVLIREREEDARFREQNGTPVSDTPQKPKPQEHRESTPAPSETTAPEHPSTDVPATPPAEPVAPAESAPTE